MNDRPDDVKVVVVARSLHATFLIHSADMRDLLPWLMSRFLRRKQQWFYEI